MDALEDFVQQYIESVAGDLTNNFLVDSQFAEGDDTPETSEQRSLPQPPQPEPDDPNIDLITPTEDPGAGAAVEDPYQEDSDPAETTPPAADDSEPAGVEALYVEDSEPAGVEAPYVEDSEEATVTETQQEDAPAISPDDMFAEDSEGATVDEVQEDAPLPYQEYSVGEGDTVFLPPDPDPEIEAMIDYGRMKISFDNGNHVDAIPELPPFADLGVAQNMGDMADTMLAGLPFTGLLEDRR